MKDRVWCAALLWAALLPRAWAVEQEPVYAAADLIQPSLLAGPGFRVDGEARLSGLQARFVLRTEWGAIEAESVEMLALRVSEMPQLAALMSRDLTDVLGEAGLDELGKPLRSARALGSEPVKRLARLPGGVLRYFTHRLREWGRRGRRLGMRIEQQISHEGSPYQGLQLGETTEVPAARASEPWWDAPVDELGRLLRSEAGHGRARRAIAAAFGVDPGTSHPLIRRRLDELAWAVASQRLVYEQALGLALPIVAQVMSELQRADALTRLPDEDSLRAANESRLETWTADAELRFALAQRGAFSPSLLGALLDELDRLAPQAGAESVLEVARMAEGEAEARFVLQALRLLQAPRAERLGAGELVAIGALLGWRDGSGEFFLALPVDHLSWIRRVEHYFDHAQVARFPRRTALVAGSISERAAREMTRRGWSQLSYVRYPGAPPYRDPADVR